MLNRKIQVLDVRGPTLAPCHRQPQFDWLVNIVPTQAPGEPPPTFVIQRMESVVESTDCAGAPFNPDPYRVTPRYWEAWSVVLGSALHPDMEHGADDLWRRTFVVPSRGRWSITGTLYKSDAPALPADFAPGKVPDALALPSTTTDPGREVLDQPVGQRRMAGAWDCCDPDPSKQFHVQKR